ncbi:16S rRNA (adenine(1518)-N(6)/adenine(1519)-N(6))-dimethyltransferase RsmA [Guggenheimella bovis]
MNYQRTNPSFLRELLNFHNLKARKHFGQNFLIDGNIVENILDGLDLKREDQVLEIGPGMGALTERLLDRVDSLTAVEIDRDLSEMLQNTLPNHLKIIEGDILKIDPMTFPKGVKVVANLPYYITSPILMHFIESDLEYDRLVFMMQKEVAERLASPPGTKEYGVLTVVASAFSDIEILFGVSRNCFHPVPGVDSAVVRITPNKKATKEIIPVVKAAFSKRRKTILNSLSSSFPNAKVALEKASIDPTRRAETLSLEEYTLLTKTLMEER